MNTRILLPYLRMFPMQMGSAAQYVLPCLSVNLIFIYPIRSVKFFPIISGRFFFDPSSGIYSTLPSFIYLFNCLIILDLSPSRSILLVFPAMPVLHPNLLSFIRNSIEPSHTPPYRIRLSVVQLSSCFYLTLSTFGSIVAVASRSDE